MDYITTLASSGSGSVVERHLAKVQVAVSTPVSRSTNKSQALVMRLAFALAVECFEVSLAPYLSGTAASVWQPSIAPKENYRTRLSSEISR